MKDKKDMTAKEWTKKTIKDLAKRRKRKEALVDSYVIGTITAMNKKKNR